MFKPICVILVIFCCSGVISQDLEAEDGLEAYDGTFPWATYVEVLDDITMEYITECFGNIIAPTWVLVPAKCVRTMYSTYRLHFGNTNFTQSEISMISRKDYIHPLYNPSEVFPYNGGLIELPIPLSFTGTISAITLPFNINEEELVGTNAYFIGRRHIINPLTEISHTMVRWNTVEIISNEHCESLPEGRPLTLLCAFGTVENPQRFPAEALGHLAVYNNLKYVLIGTAGHEHFFNKIGKQLLFTRVSELFDWITDITGISD